MKRILILVCAVLLLSGCATIKLNYGSLVSETFTPKSNDFAIILTTEDLNRPYKEIGVISALANYENATYDQLNEKIKQKAREVGADAVIKIEYGITLQQIIIPPMLGATVPLPSCKGVAVVFIDNK